MAEEKAPTTETTATPVSTPSGTKPYLLIGLVVVNMLVVAFVGFMVWKGRKADEAKPGIEKVIEGEHQTQVEEQAKPEEVGKVIPLETFIVNLAGSKGRKVLKVNMELEVKGQEVIQEIENRKAQIRDFIIIILSSKSYDEVSAKEGKDALRNEIKDNINSFLSKGKIINVYFTELIYN
ncbi:flagellar basal body-associated FliL family protein [bacterium]|nr:flagellar basal body-associated FliL family protein [bacterium]